MEEVEVDVNRWISIQVPIIFSLLTKVIIIDNGDIIPPTHRSWNSK